MAHFLQATGCPQGSVSNSIGACLQHKQVSASSSLAPAAAAAPSLDSAVRKGTLSPVALVSEDAIAATWQHRHDARSR
eukprot:CAMPEP_0170405544 /NCGR_PEP_ID=MMETSP0117_2-20130122/27235_1 /TAXON_ID=400756 /ORGANISM="Durinskia baltica, Strain CSIRO CS-38" /LENGTH=77 /DNA_ID=CAMNT_0010662661 /DNA_START=132 /DNA_END=361 /DNA_ORIENTATION=+